jgi:RNA polymerase sigma-70 factor (ECF subfamily)
MDNMNPASSRSPPELGAIFDEHFDYVWATLRRLGISEADREDLVHEVFLKVHSRLADYDQSRPLRPWLFGFAYRVAADHHRLARHRVEVLGSQGETAAENIPADERVAALEERDLLHSALQTIELDRRAVLVMHDIDDVPVPQIAAMFDIPLNTAYSRLRLAREQLAGAVTRLRVARGIR